MRKYFGTGVLTFPKIGDFSGSFSLTFNNSGKATLEFEPRKIDSVFINFLLRKRHPVGSFKGSIKQPAGSLKIDEIHFGRFIQNGPIYKLSFDLFCPIFAEFGPLVPNDVVELRRGLTNFLFYGEDITQRGNEHVVDAFLAEDDVGT